MEKKVIMDVGNAFSREQFLQLTKESKYHIIYIGTSLNTKHLKNQIGTVNIDYMEYEKLYNFDSFDIKNEHDYDLVSIINNITSDKNTFDIWERCRAPFIFNYAMKSENDIISMIVSSFKFLRSEKPHFLLFYECPHSIESWIIAKVAENISIPVRYCRNAIFHWRNVLLEGMNNNPKLFNAPELNIAPKKEEIDLFLQTESSYKIGTESIKPEFMMVMKERKQKKLFSFWQDIKINWKRPYVSLYKYVCYKAHNKVCYNFDTSVGKYIVFFMHLQPERTTLPEGYGFCNHYKAIKLLSELIPNDWTIYVKEHPANFYTKCSPCGRWPSFYTSIASINKVKFVPLETDPYYMIEKCECVTTITGTIARESLMMGKPVINFGLNTLYTILPKGMHNYTDVYSLNKFIEDMQKLDTNEIKISFHELILNTVLYQGINGFSNIAEWKNTGTCIITANQQSRFELMKHILSK